MKVGVKKFGSEIWLRLLLPVFYMAAICHPLVIYGQDNQLRFQHLNTQNGLSNNIVYCLLQDSKGYLWAGTYDGLNRFDGYSFTSFQHDPSNTNSISNGPIAVILEDRNKNLWIGTSTGKVCSFNPGTEVFTSIKGFEELSMDSKFAISSLTEDEAGNIWIGTLGKGLYKYNIKRKELTAFHQGKKPALDHISALHIDKNKNLWIGVFSVGFVFYNVKKDSFYSVLPEIIGNNAASISVQIQSIYKIDEERLLLGTKNGWAVFNTKNYNIKRYHFQPQLKAYAKNIAVSAITKDKKGYFWISTNNGIYKFDLQTGISSNYSFQLFDHYSLSSDIARNIITDYSNNLWIATDEGINKLDAHRGNFINYNSNIVKKESLIKKEVRSIYVDNDGTIWAGTEGGLNRITNEKIIAYNHDEKFSDEHYNKINTLYKDRSGKLWIGSPRGIQFFDYEKGKLIHKKYPGQIAWSPYSTWSILEDSDKIMWFGTHSHGLYSYHPANDSFINYGIEGNNKLPAEAVWGIFEDSKKNFWIGTNRGVFKRIKGDGLQNYSFKKIDNDKVINGKLSGENAWWFHEDKNNNIWIGTSDGGLNKLNPATEKFTHYKTEEGLPSNTISAILEDKRGFLWVSTVNGLCKFDPVAGKAIRSYHTEDGLFGNHFNFKSAFKTLTGEMFFGGKEGITIFHPDSIEINTSEPQISVSSFKILYNEAIKDLLADSNISLNYNQNSFSFDFASLDLTNPAKNQFSYFLEGFDKEWVNAGTRHFVSYTNLDPGEYTFRLKGTNSDGTWSKNEAAFRIIILQPFWQAWWFKLSIFLLLGGLVGATLYALFKRNVEKRRRVQSELAALRNQLNPHFVFNSLTSLQHFIIENERGLALDYLSKFAVLMRMILENSKQKFITIEEEKKFLELYLYMEAARFEKKFSFKITVDPLLDSRKDSIPPMLLQPVVENAIKHGLIAKKDDGRINVNFKKQGQNIHCIVEDNGVGRNKAMASKAKSNIAHHSMSTEIINEKLQLISNHRKKKSILNYTDLYDYLGNSTGTIVEMEIPLSN